MRRQQEQVTASLDDQPLWQVFKQGNHQAYATIYHRNVRVLFSYGSKLTDDHDLIKDSIQDLFYYLWEHRTALGETDHIRRYLFVALRRRLATKMKQRSSPEPVLDNPPFTPSYESAWIDQHTRQAHHHHLQQALQALPDRQQEAVFFKYYQNMNSEEIAQVMNINRRAVYKLLTKAIRNLKQSWPSAIKLKLATVG